MTYKIGSITITAEELADIKNTDIDCKFWIKRIQTARAMANDKAQHAVGNGLVPYDIFKLALESELSAIGVKML